MSSNKHSNVHKHIPVPANTPKEDRKAHEVNGVEVPNPEGGTFFITKRQYHKACRRGYFMMDGKKIKVKKRSLFEAPNVGRDKWAIDWRKKEEDEERRKAA